MKKSTLLLIDGHNIFIRSFIGLMRQGFTAPDGSGTWGPFGAYSVVTNLIRHYHPSHLLIAFDQGRSAKRLAIDPEYKANRHKKSDKPKSPTDEAFADEFKPQMSTFMNLCIKSGLPFFRIENVEADDIIATAALKYANTFDKIIIVSADHDLHQLIRDNIIVIKPAVNYRDIEAEVFDIRAIRNEWGVMPSRLSEIWALMGDKGDNVKGIPGIGPKKATKLIADHGTLENVLSLDDPKIQNNIDVVRKAYSLINLDIDEDIPFPPLGDLQFNPVEPSSEHAAKLENLFNILGFNQFKDRWEKRMLWSNAPKFGRSL